MPKEIEQPVGPEPVMTEEDRQAAIAAHEKALQELLNINMRKIARLSKTGSLIVEERLLDADIWELVGKADITQLMLLQLLRNTTPHQPPAT